MTGDQTLVAQEVLGSIINPKVAMHEESDQIIVKNQQFFLHAPARRYESRPRHINPVCGITKVLSFSKTEL